MFGTIAHNYLVGGESEAVFVLQLCANGFAQRQVAWHWAVEREIVVDSLLGSLLDVVGGAEVRFTNRQVDYIYTLCLELAAFL